MNEQIKEILKEVSERANSGRDRLNAFIIGITSVSIGYITNTRSKSPLHWDDVYWISSIALLCLGFISSLTYQLKFVQLNSAIDDLFKIKLINTEKMRQMSNDMLIKHIEHEYFYAKSYSSISFFKFILSSLINLEPFYAKRSVIYDRLLRRIIYETGPLKVEPNGRVSCETVNEGLKTLERAQLEELYDACAFLRHTRFADTREIEWNSRNKMKTNPAVFRLKFIFIMSGYISFIIWKII